jgi:hypothetical protein
MTQTPAGWFPDPEDATQLRYWDGAVWTEHRAPRPATTTDQLAKAGGDIADGIAKGFTALGSWVQQQRTTGPTFASVAASCRDEPAREPLSVAAELVLGPLDLQGIGQVFAQAATTIAPEGAMVSGSVCRFVPNPWDPAQPNGVAVLIGTVQVGRLPADLEASYCPPLAQLTTQRVLATGTAELWASGPGIVSTARVSVKLPEVASLARPTAAPPA